MNVFHLMISNSNDSLSRSNPAFCVSAIRDADPKTFPAANNEKAE